MPEPATDAYRALDNLKQDITTLITQRDGWIKRYDDVIHDLAEVTAERDYWQAVAAE
jgi:hypothetical protein